MRAFTACILKVCEIKTGNDTRQSHLKTIKFSLHLNLQLFKLFLHLKKKIEHFRLFDPFF